MREYNQPVKKYYVKCALYAQGVEYQYNVLAVNSENALTMVDRSTDWDEIQVHKLTGIIGMAQFSARNITNDESMEFSLNYHCKPV